MKITATARNMEKQLRKYKDKVSANKTRRKFKKSNSQFISALLKIEHRYEDR